MQKVFITITLALTLACAFATFSVQSYVKPPVDVVADSETNFTTMPVLELASITVDDLYLVSENLTVNPQNSSNSNWVIWYRKLDAKSLTGNANNSAAFTSPIKTFFLNNYAIGYTITGETDVSSPNSQVRAYQAPLTGGAPLPAIILSSNGNATFTPEIVAVGVISKTVYVFYRASESKINVTNFAAGGAKGSNEFTLTAAYDTTGSLSLAWGESLGKNQFFVSWIESGILKDSVVDVSKGTVAPVNIEQYDKAYKCFAYATDKKWYGTLCWYTNTTLKTTTYYVRTNTSALTPLRSYEVSPSAYQGHYAYGPYLAIVYIDFIDAAGSHYAYEIFNLDTLYPFRNKTQFLTIDSNSTSEFYRVTSGGLYTLLYNNRAAVPNSPVTSVQVGLLLGSSYLASIFGFLLTIIASLFFF